MTVARACGYLAAAAAVWFLVSMIHPVGPPALLWITIPLYGPLLCWAFWQTSRGPDLPAASRRFWRHLTPVPLLVGAGQTAQAIDVLRHPQRGGAYTGPVLLVFDGVALLILIYALVRLPTGGRDRSGVLRVLLDAATVMFAFGVFIWHFNTRPMVGTAPSEEVAYSLLLVLLSLLAVFALAKVLLSDHEGVIDSGALRTLGAAILVGGLVPMLQPLLSILDGRLYALQISIPAVFYLGAKAAAHQRGAVWQPGRGAGQRRRPFSLLPYSAVAAADALLLWAACVDLADIVVVAGAAVALTALVVTRQILALRDNGRLVAQLDHGATHDALTGLPNRVLFHRRLQLALEAPDDRPVSVVLIDLDDFKEVNDTLGHEVGDLLLVALARRLAACVATGDTVARLGGDEFVMVLDGCDPAGAGRVADRITATLREPVLADGYELAIRASIGIAHGRRRDEPSILLRQADIAMYAAKKVPGTAYLHYHAQMAVVGRDGAGRVAEPRRRSNVISASGAPVPSWHSATAG
jgi:diguanylate cyclase (GGDEF)-like protein